jgi:hypothetical protein
MNTKRGRKKIIRGEHLTRIRRNFDITGDYEDVVFQITHPIVIDWKLVEISNVTDADQHWWGDYLLNGRGHFLVILSKQYVTSVKGNLHIGRKYKIVCSGTDDYFLEMNDLSRSDALDIFEKITAHIFKQELFDMGFQEG